MAIDSVVIRYLPFDPFETNGGIGVSKYPMQSSTSKHTAFYPGNEAYTSIGFASYGGSPGYFSSMDMASAGIVGAVREWEFVTLAEDAVTIDQIDLSTDTIYMAYFSVYSGGTLEIGAYISGVYTTIGTADLGIPFDPDTGWDFIGGAVIALDWGPVPAFWTQLRKVNETP